MIHSCDHTCFCFGQTSVRNSNSGYNGECRPEFWILSKIVCTRIQCTLLQSHALKKWSPYELMIIRAASIFCIHKISSQCYKMKLYQHSLSFPPSFPSSFANQRQEFIHESTPAETQAVLIRNCTNLKKHRRIRREQKNSTPFLKWSFRGHQHHLTKPHICRSNSFRLFPSWKAIIMNTKNRMICKYLQIIRFLDLRHGLPHPRKFYFLRLWSRLFQPCHP